MTTIRPELQAKAEARDRAAELEFYSNLMNYHGGRGCYPLRRREIDHIILKHKFKELSKNWSL